MKSVPRRLAVLRGRQFRLFFTGYAVSLFGSSTASVAVAFAVLDGGGGGSGLGVVMAARIVPVVLLLVLGGAAADRLGPRRTMLGSDALRCATQAATAALLFAGHGGVWALAALMVLWGLGEAVFLPALDALLPRIVPAADLADANALSGIARNGAAVAGPALAGLLTAAAGPGWVLLLDAASYAAGLAALALLHVPPGPAADGSAPGLPAELRDGWGEFRSRRWLWASVLQGCLFNLLVWAPFLVLGPVLAREHLGGAGGWGAVMGAYGAGAVLGGLVLLGRRPGRPLRTVLAVTAGWALPSGALALGGPLPVVMAAAAGAGVTSIVSGSLFATLVQRHVPPHALGRVGGYVTLGAFAFGPVGLALAGPLASAVGARTVLGWGAAWQLASCAAVLALLGRREPATAGPDPGTAPAPDVRTAPVPSGRDGGRGPSDR
ncbi:MFS transporter [Kitasatospora phosalacinea]|uniref:MFS transporter n=1 Tax=Kitasatospora phosalacinea TaxID=2065 RepID=UPI000527C61F|nr:MFS transporter [Kitasatospora phosalacinea]